MTKGASNAEKELPASPDINQYKKQAKELARLQRGRGEARAADTDGFRDLSPAEEGKREKG